MSSIIIPIFALALLSIFIVYTKYPTRENFDATGYVYNIPPNWFIKKDYNPEDWLVPVYPEQIQPECLYYSRASKFGSMADINYNSQAYRFWRY